ncbi:galactokinase [Streptomyces sp. 2224.1]|uniref:galactokinase n=1 Tax=unclassified Streptomyces TaxID=2593676 RepID=UPI00088D6343|nr:MULTISPECIES: galactokinase [unclassified Streptomyces]PBC82878.1 galactokinase [Streptomyces sp. 2321.6]SDR46530.1 galactokinase [Streptomyces sp. KS_16]SEC29419.1 galactokinase [Streptomyces sp. 2224.1]SEC75222.1 galactokinase [Streptomyces sp. 2133.1]SEE90621.1 galactokinase [Streptomyces sp. 2112.3]
MTAHGAATPTTGRPHGAQHTAAAFAAVYGAAPTGTWAAPGRVNLIGEHTDYNDGFVMPLALPHTTLAAASARTDGVLRLHSGGADGGIVELRIDALRPAPQAGWAAYPAGVVWAMREAGLPVGGADLHYDSTVPTGAGLSSSAALEVVTAVALNDLYALGQEPQQLARLAQRAENAFVGVPCGIMDQTAAACCTEGHALFLDTRELTRRQIPFDLAGEGLRLLVVDTRVKHELGDGAYAERRAGCERGARALGVRALRDVPYAHLSEALAGLADDPVTRALVRHIVTENHRVEEVVALLDTGRTRAIGPLLTAGHASLRDDFKISCRELDLAVDTANAAGALGARMTGGGFGGSAIVLVEEADAPAVGAAVSEAFAAAGHAVPRIFEAVPSAGAHRVE